MKRKIQWNPSVACNFDCAYCFCSRELRKSQGQALHDIPGLLGIFDALKGEHTIVLGGGEPFLQKGFIELCKGLVEKHVLVVVTNLSYDVEPFIEAIPVDRVDGLAVSLHIDEREHIKSVSRFIERVHRITEVGYSHQVSQVLYPPILERFEEVYEYFKEQGIKVYPKIFEGKYENRPYPASYTEEERQKIFHYLQETTAEMKDVRYSEEILLGYPATGELTSFKGQPCSAGYDDAVIIENGSVHRCWTIRSQYTKPEYEPINLLGNIFKGGFKMHGEVMPCTYDYCFCPQMGYDCVQRAKQFGEHDVEDLKTRIDKLLEIA